MRRLVGAALLGLLLLVVVVVASAFAGAGVACGATAGCSPQPRIECTPPPGVLDGGYWNDDGSDCRSADVATSGDSTEAVTIGGSTDGGLSEAEAVELARNQIPPGGELLRVEAAGIGEFDDTGQVALPEWPRDRVVWAVEFRYDVWAFSCPMTPDGQGPAGGCDLPAMVRVVLDYWTGEVLYYVATGLE